MESRLIDCLVTTGPAAEAFTDAAVLGAMLDFEVALARAEAAAGVIPAGAADVIARAADVAAFDPAAIAEASRATATPSIPFVAALAARVQAIDPVVAGYVHFGATSQDVFDTAMVLCLARARARFVRDHRALLVRLADMSDTHAGSVMVGRTLLQPAVPTTFGLKAAGWAGALSRAWSSFETASADAFVLQCGGAAGTLAPLGAKGDEVARAVAATLGLGYPVAPWHSHRERLATVVSAVAVYVGALGKMAGDIALLMQPEIAEVAEQGGGSSTMPQKRNPSGCAIVLAAAGRLPGLAASMIGAMVQEHERGVGGWHAEAPIVRDAVVAAGSALAAALEVVNGLDVSPGRMRENIDRTGGAIFAERLAFLLAPSVGLGKAARLVAGAAAESRTSGRAFLEIVAATPAIANHLTPAELASLANPSEYLGSAETFRRRMLEEVRRQLHA